MATGTRRAQKPPPAERSADFSVKKLRAAASRRLSKCKMCWGHLQQSGLHRIQWRKQAEGRGFAQASRIPIVLEPRHVLNFRCLYRSSSFYAQLRLGVLKSARGIMITIFEGGAGGTQLQEGDMGDTMGGRGSLVHAAYEHQHRTGHTFGSPGQ